MGKEKEIKTCMKNLYEITIKMPNRKSMLYHKTCSTITDLREWEEQQNQHSTMLTLNVC